VANAEEVNRIIERAKAGGVDMSWLKAPQVQATGGVGRISPGASQLMDAVRQAQAATPAYMPFPGGTPTQRRREADEATRQFEVGQEFSREQFDWQKQMQQAQLALQRAAAARTGGAGSVGTTTPGGPAGVIPGGSYRTGTLTERDRIYQSEAGQGLINTIRTNPQLTLSEIRANIQTRKPELLHEGIDPEMFLDFADEQYYLYHFLEAASRVGKEVEPWQYGKDIRSMPWLEEQYHPKSKLPAGEQTISRQDAEWYARQSGGRYTVEDIMTAARTGQLGKIMDDILY